MQDYKPLLERISFTGVRDSYKTRDLVNVIRSRMPNGKKKDFFGKIMIQPKTKFAVGIYLKCKDPKSLNAKDGDKCKFKVFFKKFPDGIFRLVKSSERTCFICTCSDEGLVSEKDDFNKSREVIDEINIADKNGPGIVALPLFKMPNVRDMQLKNQASRNAKSSNRLAYNGLSKASTKSGNSEVKNEKAPKGRSSRSVRVRKYLEVESSSDESNDENVDNFSDPGNSKSHKQHKRRSSFFVIPVKKETLLRKSSNAHSERNSTSERLKSKRSEGLDYKPICERVSFKAGAEVKSQELRELVNKEFLKLGVDKSFTFKVGVGRRKDDFTADNVYLRCQMKPGYSDSCCFKICFKRNKSNDIWTISPDSSNTNFLCKCEDVGNNTNAIIDILSRKAPNSVDSRKANASGSLDGKKKKRNSMQSQFSVDDANKKNSEKHLHAKNLNSSNASSHQPKNTKHNTPMFGTLETFCKKVDVVIEKKLKLIGKDVRPIFEKAFAEYDIRRKFSLIFMSNGRLPDSIILKLLSDEDDESEYSEYLGNSCKMSVFFQRDAKACKRFNFMPLSVETNFVCVCKTCSREKTASGDPTTNKKKQVYASDDDSNQSEQEDNVQVKGDLIVPIGYIDNTISDIHSTNSSPCSQCAQYSHMTEELNAFVSLKLKPLYNKFD